MSIKGSIIVLSALLFVSCGQERSADNTKDEAKSENTQQRKSTKGGAQNYAVVWSWLTKDAALVEENVVAQADQLTELWKKDLIENAYFNTEPSDQLANNPDISFFIKTASEEKAHNLMDDMIFVKKGISEYKLYPVGTKWLGRNTDDIWEGNTKNSYVSIWSTRVDHNSKMSMEEVKENAKAQSDRILELWNEGQVENVYFDIVGTQERNDVTDFVMFVNADSEQDARAMLDDLPFSKKNIAHYQLEPVGVHWMGVYGEE